MVAHAVLQRFEQQFVVDRFFQKLGGAGLEGAPAQVHRAMTREHDDGLVDALRHQAVKHRQTADARHAHVEHDDADALAVERGHEGLRVGPGLHAQPHGADQQSQTGAHGLVVVNQVDQR